MDDNIIQPASPVLGAVDDHLVDAESLGERILEPIKRTQPEEILAWLREKLKEGNFIYASDLDGAIFRVVKGDNDEEAIASGLIIDKMHNRPRKISRNNMPTIRY